MLRSFTNYSSISDHILRDMFQKYTNELDVHVVIKQSYGHPLNYRLWGSYEEFLPRARMFWTAYDSLFRVVTIYVPTEFEPFCYNLLYTRLPMCFETLEEWIESVIVHEMRHAAQLKSDSLLSLEDHEILEIDAEQYTLHWQQQQKAA